MATTSKDLRIRYLGDAAGVKKTLSELDRAHSSFASRLQSIGKSMVRTGKTLTLGLTLPILAFFKAAATEFTEFQQVNAQTGAALESTGGAAGVTMRHIQDLGREIGALAVIDNEAVQSMENILLTFPKIRNEVGAGADVFDQAALAVADMSARLGKDLNSAAIMVGKALNDPIRGVTALGRAGVQFTDQQREMIAGFVEQGDLLSAQKIILSELSTEFAGSAAAMGKTASPMQKLSVAFQNFAEAAGAVIVPVLDKIAAFLSRMAERFQDLSPGMRELIVKALAVAAALGPLLIISGKLISAWGTLRKAMIALRASAVASSTGLGGLASKAGAARVAMVALAAVLGQKAFDSITFGARDLAAEMQITDDTAKALQDRIGGFKLFDVHAWADPFALTSTKLREAAEAWVEFRSKAIEAGVATEQVSQAFWANIEILNANRASIDDWTAAMAHDLGLGEDRFEATGDAAIGMAGKIDRSAELSGDALKEFRKNTKASLSFGVTAFAELADGSRITARKILASLRQANDAADEFAKDARGFLRDVQEEMGPRMSGAAKEMVKSLITSGAEGQKVMQALAQAPPKVRESIIREFARAEAGPKGLEALIKSVNNELDRLNGRHATFDVTYRSYVIGKVPPGLPPIDISSSASRDFGSRDGGSRRTGTTEVRVSLDRRRFVRSLEHEYVGRGW